MHTLEEGSRQHDYSNPCHLIAERGSRTSRYALRKGDLKPPGIVCTLKSTELDSSLIGKKVTLLGEFFERALKPVLHG